MSAPPVPPARRLAAAIEPVAGQAQFAPECHRAYEALGFAPSPRMVGRTHVPDPAGHFTSRGSVMGQVPGHVVAAAFAVFNPERVVPLVDAAWERTDAPTVWAAREAGAVAQLRRVLGADPAGAGEVADRLLEAAVPLPLAGRPLFAGQRSLDVPQDPVARLWRATDMLREYRGDSHIQVWSAAGFDAVEIGLLGDVYWGLAPRTHTAGRGWSDDQLTAGEERLRAQGLLDGDQLTPAGRARREEIEAATDAAVSPAIAVLGDDLDDVIGTLVPWGQALRASGAYLTPLVRFTFDA